MALIKCHECGKEISDQARACPGCGAKPKKDRAGLYSAIVAVVAGFVLYAVSVANDPIAQEKAGKRQAIELCWSTQQSDGLSPGASSLAADTCRMMETEFLEKYGVKP